MFELEYTITDDDLKKVNKHVMWSYFIPYLAVALLGIGAGIAATVIRPSTSIFVLGIILIVLGAVLLACTIMLAVAPKSFVLSALETSDEVKRAVKISDSGITVSTDGQSDIRFGYGGILKAKLMRKAAILVLYVDKDAVLIVKDGTDGNGSVDEIYAFVAAKLKSDRAVSDTSSVESVSNDSADASADAPSDEKTSDDGDTQKRPSEDGDEQKSDAQ